MKQYLIILAAALFTVGCADNKTRQELNDSTSPLHLLRPDYKTPYGELSVDSVKADVERVFNYISSVTPAKIEDENGNEVDIDKALPDSARLHKGTFRLASYEWGVTYMALLDAARILNDKKYSDYVSDRIGYLAKATPRFRELFDRVGQTDGQMRQIVAPVTLDDAGAMSCAVMLAAMNDSTLPVKEIIERYYNIVENNTLKLADGTIARNRPHHNSVWLDDMFMALPAMAARSRYTGNQASLDEASRIAMNFFKRMWMPEKQLFRHGYVEGFETEPEMAWGRANGWALLTMCRLLDELPENHPQREGIMEMYKKHVKGLAARQNKDGFWHQLLDRNDSYAETSATAIFAYGIAHGVNQGWLEPAIYGPVAQLAWNAVSTKINNKGEVEDVCVGTGMAFDPAYYYYRPVSTKAAHGYGPVIWAGSEIVRMLESNFPRVNDSAVHYYRTDPEASMPIFSLDENGKAIEIQH